MSLILCPDNWVRYTLDIHIHNVAVHQEPDKPNCTSAIFDARSRGAATNGVCILAMGYADSIQASARDAADQWVTGVFPVIKSWLTQAKHVCTVTKSEMIVAVEETSEQFGWTVHLGPILSRVYSSPFRKYTPPEVSSSDLLKATFNAVHPFAAHNALFWIELFVARYPDGAVDATARLHNEDWPEGKNALLSWALQWPDTEGCLLSRRQFLMFEPMPVNQLNSRRSMHQTLDGHAAQKRSWWKQLNGGS